MADTTPSDIGLHDVQTKSMSAQVGGHAGVLTSEDGSLLIKPALALEINFYEHVANESAFAPLRPFLPRFYGILKLQGKVADAAATTLEPIEEGEEKDRSSFFDCSQNYTDICVYTVYCARESYRCISQAEYPRHQAWHYPI
jgi:hypothetical protein